MDVRKRTTLGTALGGGQARAAGADRPRPASAFGKLLYAIPVERFPLGLNRLRLQWPGLHLPNPPKPLRLSTIVLSHEQPGPNEDVTYRIIQSTKEVFKLPPVWRHAPHRLLPVPEWKRLAEMSVLEIRVRAAERLNVVVVPAQVGVQFRDADGHVQIEKLYREVAINLESVWKPPVQAGPCGCGRRLGGKPPDCAGARG